MRNRTRNSRSYGLDVNVARALLDGGHQEEVHHPDDRGLATLPLEAGDVELPHLLEDLDIVGRDVVLEGEGGNRERVGGRARAVAVARRLAGAAGVVLRDRLADRGLGGDDRLDVVARHELDVVEREDVGRVCHRDRERRSRSPDRHDLVLLRGLGRNQLEDGDVDVELREVDEGNAVLTAEERGDLLVVDHSELDERHAQLAAIGLLMVQGLLQLRGSDALFPE